MKMANSYLVKTLLLMYVCLILEATYAGQVYSLVGQGHGMMRSGMLGWRKVGNSSSVCVYIFYHFESMKFLDKYMI